MTQTWQHLEIYDQGEQVPGFALYGVGGPNMSQVKPSAFFSAVRFCDSFLLVSESARVILWEFAVASWEVVRPRWEEMLDKYSCELFETGGVPPFLGGEGMYYADPPDLFASDVMAGQILGWQEPGFTGR